MASTARAVVVAACVLVLFLAAWRVAATVVGEVVFRLASDHIGAAASRWATLACAPLVAAAVTGAVVAWDSRQWVGFRNSTPWPAWIA